MKTPITTSLSFALLLAPCATALAAPLDLGHRGTGVNKPGNPFAENTLASFVYAVDVEGADGIELDVQLARPNGNADLFDELVIMHDESLVRTTTCRSAAPLDDCVLARTMDDIRANCLPVNGAGQTTGEIVPTLREVLDTIVRQRGKRVNIEVKNQPPTDGDSQREACSSLDPLAVSSLVSDLLLAEYSSAERALVIFSSFNPEAAALAKHESTVLGSAADGGVSSVDTGFLFFPFGSFGAPVAPDPRIEAFFAKGLGLDAIHPGFEETDAALVDFAHLLGMTVRPWTVNERCGMRRLIDIGVDAIITDEPDRLRDEIQSPTTGCPVNP